MQAGQCGNRMGTRCWELVCDEHGIGGDGEYCGNNDTQLGRMNVFYNEASGGKNVAPALLFNLELGLIGGLRASPLGKLFRPGSSSSQNSGAGINLAKAHYKDADHDFF